MLFKVCKVFRSSWRYFVIHFKILFSFLAFLLLKAHSHWLVLSSKLLCLRSAKNIKCMLKQHSLRTRLFPTSCGRFYKNLFGGGRVTRFGEISPVWQKFISLRKKMTVYFLFGKILSLLWQIWDIVGLIFSVANGQIFKNDLTIWSHWAGRGEF